MLILIKSIRQTYKCKHNYRNFKFISLGNTPSDGQTIEMTACEVGFVHDCERQYTIAVKKCSSFLVYKLKPLDVCSAAYCFGKSDISHLIFLIVLFAFNKIIEMKLHINSLSYLRIHLNVFFFQNPAMNVS